jgi:hypothetical protein
MRVLAAYPPQFILNDVNPNNIVNVGGNNVAVEIQQILHILSACM